MKKQDKRWHTNPELWDKLKHIAYEKRHKPTEAEKALWKHLRMHRLYGIKFRRQHSIGQFIVDFYCKEAKLIIEVDGEIHQYQIDEDSIRQKYLEHKEFKVIRFTNEMVLKNIEEVMKQIKACLASII